MFAKYFKGNVKRETILLCLEGYLKHNIALANIIAVATDCAPAIVGPYRGFAALLNQKVPSVRNVHYVLHRRHLVAKKLSGKLHDACNVCIRSINKIKAYLRSLWLYAMLFEKMMKLRTNFFYNGPLV